MFWYVTTLIRTMETLLDRLRSRGMRITPQRRAIAEVLVGEHVHLTAEDVLAQARVGLPELSQATVYATLTELVALGEVQEIATGDGRRRFDPNVGHAHHHLVCTACGAIRDVAPVGLDAIEVPEDDLGGYTLTRADITFRGLCPDCTAKAAATV